MSFRDPRPDDNPLEYTNRLVRKVNRLERALSALLEDVANNPLTAVEMARFELDRAD